MRPCALFQQALPDPSPPAAPQPNVPLTDRSLAVDDIDWDWLSGDWLLGGLKCPPDVRGQSLREMGSAFS